MSDRGYINQADDRIMAGQVVAGPKHLYEVFRAVWCVPTYDVVGNSHVTRGYCQLQLSLRNTYGLASPKDVKISSPWASGTAIIGLYGDVLVYVYVST